MTIIDIIKNTLFNESALLTNVASIMTILVPVFTIIGIIWNIGVKIWIARRRTHVCPDCLEMKEVNQYTRLYIKTRFYKTKELANQRNDMYNMKDFVRRYLDKGDDQYHWVFGESGTGKTAFLINMYFYYNCRLFKKNNMYYISLRSTNVLEEIKTITESTNCKNTILLLDAFDEAKASMIDANEALNNIVEATKSFNKVVITCRTHFFDTMKDEPKIIDVKRAVLVDDEIFVKHFVCPFSSFEVLQYLIKHYRLKLWNVVKGAKVIKTSANIMARPLLLSYIDDIVYEKQNYRYAYQIYNTLIQKWIEREINFIRKTSSEYVDTLSFTHRFWDFTYEIAKIMLLNAKNKDDYSIEYQQLEDLCVKYKIDNSIAKRSRTLLNRTSNDMFVFSHKSIFEYLLVAGVKAGRIELDFSKINISPLDQLMLFISEMHQNGELKEIISKNAYRMQLSINEALQKEKMKASIEAIDIFPETNQIIVKLIIHDTFCMDTTIGMVKEFWHTLCEHDFSQYTIFSVFDGNKYNIKNAYMTVIDNITGFANNKNIIGKLIMDMRKPRLFLMDDVGKIYPYWDITLFVEKMPIDMITQFVLEQLSIPDNNGTVIYTANSDSNIREIFIKLTSVEE